MTTTPELRTLLAVTSCAPWEADESRGVILDDQPCHADVLLEIANEDGGQA